MSLESKANNPKVAVETKQQKEYGEKSKGTLAPSETGKRVEEIKNEEKISENLSTIDNKKFLELSREKRLGYITAPSIESKNIKENSKIIFNFTFEGKFNNNLYLRTTAGQVLPPEVSIVSTNDGETYKRSGLYGEFFTEDGNRLFIHQGTEINIKKYSNKTIGENGKEITIEEREKEFEKKSLEFGENKDIALEALRRGINPKFTQNLFKDLGTGISRKVDIEYKFTELERAKDYFKDDFYGKEILSDNGELSPEFLAYYLNLIESDNNKKIEIFKGLGLQDKAQDLITDYKRREYKGYSREFMSNKDIQEIMKNLGDVPEEFKKERFGFQYVPGSKECQILFLYACKAANLPKEWAFSESLHRLISKESNGRVGIMNYTFKYKVSSPEQFKEVAVKNEGASSGQISRSLGVRSNATGLGQMLISNVDKYYPDGRKGIGVPISEAIGMLKYIEDRYGNPEIANNMHGKLGTYNHPIKGKIPKKFKEGY